MQSKYLMDRIYDLEQLLPLLPAELLRQDLSGLVLSVAESVGMACSVRNLHQTPPLKSRVHTDTLRAVADVIETLNLGGPHVLPPERSLEPASILSDFRSCIESLQEDARALDPAAQAIRLKDCGAVLADLLLCAALVKADLSPIVDATRRKLELLDEQEAMEVWSRIKSEASRESPGSIKIRVKIVPKSWLKTTTVDEAKKKIADYLVSLKPRLQLAMLKAGRVVVPDDAPPLASLLTWSRPTAATPASHVEQDIATALRRLRSYWESVLARPGTEFDLALGMRISLPDQTQAPEASPECPPGGNYAERLIIYELKKIIRALAASAEHEAAIEKALIQYKLGIEILAPDNIKDLLRKDELRLQKEVCKFLLDQGIFAVGSRFATTVTEVFAGLPDGGAVIETKIYKDAARVTEKAIKGHLVELHKALSGNAACPRGVLVIYNFSSTSISAPRGWIDGRLRLLPINLQQQPPSSKNRTLVLERAEGDGLIRVVTA
jgi:hypothetical protein